MAAHASLRKLRFEPGEWPSIEPGWLPQRGRRAQPRKAVLLPDLLDDRLGDLHQAPWMGRSCFRGDFSTGYVVIKGLGPGPGSEWMRALIDSKMRQAWPEAGCLRLQDGTRFPLLVPFKRGRSSWRIESTRPEGVSRFALCVLEAEAAELYRRAGIPVLRPRAVFRISAEEPWGGRTAASLRQFLRTRLPYAIQRHLGLASIPQPLVIGSQYYAHLDLGIIVREAASPFRIANLYQSGIDGDRPALRRLLAHMSRVHDCPPGGVRAAFVDRMAATAAALFSEGVVHGQLHIHHQDISLAGELADLDCSIALRMFGENATDIPFGPSRVGAYYLRYRQRLRRLESEYGCPLLDDLERRYAARFLGTAGLAGWRRRQIASSLLRQLFDVYCQTALALDRLCRTSMKNLAAPGLALKAAEREAARRAFAEGFARTLARRRAAPLFRWCLRHGFEKLIEEDLRTLGRCTLYALWGPRAPLDFPDRVGDGETDDAVRLEATTLFTMIAAHRRMG